MFYFVPWAITGLLFLLFLSFALFVFALISMLRVMSLRELNESEIMPVKIEWYESLSEIPFTYRKNNHSSNAMSSYLDFHP